MNMHDLYYLIDKKDVISFDIFDTLIKRCVDKPRNIFEYVENKYITEYGKEDGIIDFKKKRIDAEKNARTLNGEKEISFQEIYDILAKSAKESILNRYKELEIKTELDLCIANPEIKTLYEYCKRRNKRLIVVSDMYLPLEIIKHILEKNGYTGFDAIYLSSEIKKTKSKGDLYDYVLKKENVDPKQILHIGDNRKADVLNAQKRGIKAFRVIEKKQHAPNQLLERDEVLDNFIKHTSEENELFYRIGYECFGPLLFGFIRWIKEEARKKNIEKIYFLSRDGYIMKQVYQLLSDDTDIPCEYMLASRRALQGTVLHINSEFEDIIDSMFIPREITIGWFLKKWGLSLEECECELNKLNLRCEQVVDFTKVKENSELKELYKLLKDKIIYNSKEEYKAFIEYLNSIGFSGNVAVVDIGWYGNMQNSLMTALSTSNLDLKVTGFYLGIVPSSKHQDAYDMNGYIFQKNKNEELFYTFKYLNTLLELFFMAPHGSVCKYEIVNGIPGVNLDEFEFQNTYTLENICKIQEGARSFVEKFRDIGCYSNNNELVNINMLYSTFMRPTYMVAKYFGDLEVFENKWKKIAPKPQIKKIKRDLLNTPWKMGYLKRLLKIPLCYDRIIFEIRKVYIMMKS